MSKFNPSRRKALAWIGAGAAYPLIANPFNNLALALVESLIQEAQATELGNTVIPRRYFHINLPGGPPRWLFDNPLNPYSGQSLLSNPMIVTRFGANGIPEYHAPRLTSSGLYMPDLWSKNIPVFSGAAGTNLAGQASFVPMENLLQNTLIIRGVNMLVDGHDQNRKKQLRPVADSPSLDGLVADRSFASIPAVGSLMNGSSGIPSFYNSGLGIGQIQGNSVDAILAPFKRTTTNSSVTAMNDRSKRESLKLAMDQALGVLGAYSKTSNPGASALQSMRSRAESVLNNNALFSGSVSAANTFTKLKSDYTELIKACVPICFPSVNNADVLQSTIIGGGTPIEILDRKRRFFRISNDGIAERYTEFGSIGLKSILSGTGYQVAISSMADNFAMAEFLLDPRHNGGGHPLVSAFSCGLNSAGGFRAPAIHNSADGSLFQSNQTFNIGHDAHDYGQVLTLIFFSFYFHALSACLNHFISRLGSAAFKETVIHIASEFGRDPREAGNGSDHGWSANSVSILSGAIPQPMVLGNVYRDSQNGAQREGTVTQHRGSWGSAAPVDLESTPRAIEIGNVATTLATLLRIQSPTPNNRGLVSASGDQVAPTVENAKEVA